MADRWEIRYKADGKGCEVWRNGSWYTDAKDEYEAEGLLLNQRVKGAVPVVEPDGYRRTRRI